jgi:hypothetical protein
MKRLLLFMIPTNKLLNKFCFGLFLLLGLLSYRYARSEVRRPLPLIRLQYNDTLVIREKSHGPLIVLSAMSDPILFNSKCYVSLWKIDSIEQLNAYLAAQHNEGKKKPKSIAETKSHFLTLDTPQATEFNLFNKRFSWLPGGAREGFLLLWEFDEQTKIGILKHSQILPPFGEDDLMTVAVYNIRNEAQK